MILLNLHGRKFGRLTVLDQNGRIGSFKAWNCVCECGALRRLSSRSLVSGHTKSCGCFRVDFTTAKNTTHGLMHSNAHEYRTWTAMRRRCNDKNDPKYPRYGGRGITICKRWGNFARFLSDMGPKPTAFHTIERDNNDGPYAPANCRWATPREQSRNKSNNRWITANGVTRCLTDWAEITGKNAGEISRRIDRGWTPEEAVAV